MRKIPELVQQWQENPPSFGSPKYMLASVLLFLTHYSTATLAQHLSPISARALLAGAPAGIILSAFLLLDPRVWPAIFLSVFAVSLAEYAIPVSSFLALANVAEGLAGIYLVRRFAGTMHVFKDPKKLLRFVIAAAVLTPTISPSLGVPSLVVGGYADWSNYWSLWSNWWFGSMTGNLIVTPLILIVAFRARAARALDVGEIVALAMYFLLLVTASFRELPFFGADIYPLQFLCIPFLLWVALRLGQLEAAVAVAVVSALLSVAAPYRHFSSVGTDSSSSLLWMQAFIGLVAVMTHMIAATFAEHHRVERELGEARAEMAAQATTDSLTGLANYRRFVDVIEKERERSDRTGRPFALVLFDMDDLKRVNDTHGHLVGTAALQRVGTLLKVHCRNIDTAVRYGGDEFALVLPDTDWDGAWQVANRVAEHVTNDGEHPPISVSFGVAVYPNDGKTIADVFQNSDKALYVMKRRRRA
jgi:diguanylate cyclase (GGDEF)-like protein